MLTELKHSHIKKGHYYSLYLCACGVEKVLCKGNVDSGKIRSCGCFKRQQARERQTTHGMTKTPTYVSWYQMKTRCNNPNYKEFKYYGGRGIKICKRWSDFKNFLKDMGQRPKGKTLDRIDPDGNYAPKNCRWATPLQQASNKRKKERINV